MINPIYIISVEFLGHQDYRHMVSKGGYVLLMDECDLCIFRMLFLWMLVVQLLSDHDNHSSSSLPLLLNIILKLSLGVI